MTAYVIEWIGKNKQIILICGFIWLPTINIFL